jgi:hypothetical protein
MNEPKLHTFFEALIEVLIHHVVFYIPQEIIPNELVEQINHRNGVGTFDELLVMDLNQGWLGYEHEKYQTLLLIKHKNLEENLFKLLKKKVEIDPTEFKYILDKYVKQVEFYLFMSTWLNNHLVFYHKEKVDMEIQSDFRFQYNYFKKHLADLVKHLYPTIDYVFKQEYEIMEVLENYIPDLITRMGFENIDAEVLTDIINTELKSDVINSIQPKIKKEKQAKKKLVLITKEESDEFVLKTVFNIPESLIKQQKASK